MFVGAINATLRKYLASIHAAFDGARVVVGCSGNFTSEATLTQYARPTEIHSNDVSFYSCLIGAWLTGQRLAFEVVDSEYDWLAPYLDTDTRCVAAVGVLLDMLEHEKRNNPHRVRMWNLYHTSFADLVEETIEKLEGVSVRVTSFFAGDVMDHFARFADDRDAIFCCYAPTYAGGYERMYRRLDQIVEWAEPQYPMLDEARRDALLAWMAERRFLWYDDRLLPGYAPVLRQDRGGQRTVYLYSNVVPSPALFAEREARPLPDLPLAPSTLDIRETSRIWVERIKTSELSPFKDVYLSKDIDHAEGMWSLAVYLDGWVIGFFEFKLTEIYGYPSELYLMSDFPVAGTKYKRLSKLIAMLAVCGETRDMMERIREYRVRTVVTTAFTDRPVSMKYRGVMGLIKRGQTDDGQRFLQYEAECNDRTWAEVLAEWIRRHSAKR